MSLSHTELSFGDFSGLSNEEYERLFSTLSRPLSNRKVKFPWNEEEYVQSGIQALSIGDLTTDHQYLSQYYNLPTAVAGTHQSTEKNTAEGIAKSSEIAKTDGTGSAACSEKETAAVNDCPSNTNFRETEAMDNEQANSDDYSSMDVPGSNTNDDFATAAATAAASSGNGDKPRRRNKKKRDPDYYQKYYTNPELYHHLDHRGEAKPSDQPQPLEDQSDGIGDKKVQNVPVDDVNALRDAPMKLNTHVAPVVDSEGVVQRPEEECVSTNSSDQPSTETDPANLQQISNYEQTMVLSQPSNTDPIPPRTNDCQVNNKNTSEEPVPAQIEKTTQDKIGNHTVPKITETDALTGGDQGVINITTDNNEDVGKTEGTKDMPASVDKTENRPVDAVSPMHTADDSDSDKQQSVAPTSVPTADQNPSALAVNPATSSGDDKKTEEGKSDNSEIPSNNGLQETYPTQGENGNNKQGDNASAAKPKVASWAGLFKNTPVPASAPLAYVSHVSSSNEPPKTQTTAKKTSDNFVTGPLEQPVVPEEDRMAKDLGEFLLNVKFPYRALALQPRGLNNTGNWCYVNAILQALLSCPPLYNLLKCLPVTPLSRRGPSSTPMMDSLAEFVNEFQPMPPKPGGKRTAQDLRPGFPFEPTYVYRLLTIVKSSMSTRGRQEDAEEFLGFILNGLHEEMLTSTKFVTESKEGAKPDTMNGPSVENSNGPADGKVAEEVEDDDNDEEWEQVGPKNKSSITRSANFLQSSISEIFGGQMRSALHQHGSKESATLQPFFTLQLDIQYDKTWSVKDALQSLVSRETLHDYTSAKSKSEAETFRRITLEVLPPVLVLHLKRFLYDKNGGCLKLQKKIDYTVDLEISKDLLSPLVKNKLHITQRSYKLFAIVYHHGKNASGGHYTCDFYHPGINGWVRTDDTNVKPVTINSILRPVPPKVPYLLFYRRCDLI
ncbi:ubiquitin carboxyl-terminal hydrolase 10-like isoform X2 [Ptychodera flava]|uniref:ubiquitin carboxyl-terminal hydrolase 10-like isoform X2 n=1 Tax=Ptychodera flava TaxID=63121 RepID=UPI003969E355